MIVGPIHYPMNGDDPFPMQADYLALVEPLKAVTAKLMLYTREEYTVLSGLVSAYCMLTLMVFESEQELAKR